MCNLVPFIEIIVDAVTKLEVESRVVNVSVRPCQLDRPLVRPTSIRVTTR